MASATMASARGILGALEQRAFSSTPATMATRQSIASVQGSSNLSLEKIEARVFCLGTEGGNPVTIFSSTRPLSGTLQQDLARSCEWESVMVGTETSSSSSPTMAFFMPSGEEVSFCAHAAIGGAIAMRGDPGSWEFKAAMTSDSFKVDTEEVGGGDTRGAASSSCCLHMKDVRFDEAPLGKAGMSALEEWSNQLGWSMASHSKTKRSPKNASVARPKTLVELESVDAVQNAGTPPSDGSFAQACATMDDSTGVYLYAPCSSESKDILSYECRQFPRSSGYPEDPATGIAAAALAASLRFGGENQNQSNISKKGAVTKESNSIAYDIYQGTAMGRPSLIQVLNLERDSGGKLSFGLQGRVEIDATITIQVDE